MLPLGKSDFQPEMRATYPFQDKKDKDTYFNIVEWILETENLSLREIKQVFENPNFSRTVYERLFEKIVNKRSCQKIYRYLTERTPTQKTLDWNQIKMEVEEELPWAFKLLKDLEINKATISHTIYSKRETLSGSDIVNIEFIENNLRGLPREWNWEKLTVNKRISLKDIETHPELPWTGIENREDITLDFIISNQNLIKNRHNIYRYLKTEDLKKLVWTIFKPRRKKDFISLSSNKNITWELLLYFNKYSKNPTLPFKKWDMSIISKNSNITLKIIKENPQVGWCWKSLMLNPNIKWKNIERYKTKFGWTNDIIKYFSGNPNMTFSTFKSLPTLWIRELLLKNKYNKDTELIVVKRRENEAIFNHYFKIIENKNGNMGLFSTIPTELFDRIFIKFLEVLNCEE